MPSKEIIKILPKNQGFDLNDQLNALSQLQQIFMEKQTKSLKTLIYQTNPIHSAKLQNLKRIETSLQKITEADQIDIVVFPEMAFTGYNFKDKNHILPYTQVAGKGDTYDFAVRLALKLKAYVLYGYPQILDQNTFYNSACLVGPDGSLVINIRKTHLYDPDYDWCLEGQGFKTVVIKNKKHQSIKCALGICMDIYPYKFTSEKFELGDFCLDNTCDALLFISAEDDNATRDKPQQEIVDFWVSRLKPPHRKFEGNRLFVCCDRSGEETLYFRQKQETGYFIGTSHCTVYTWDSQNTLYMASRCNEEFEIVQATF